MKLHLGCFDQPAEGWHNTDITGHIFISRIPFAASVLAALGKMPEGRLQQHREGIFRKVHYLNVSKPFPFASGSVDAVFSSHIIEHLHPETARHFIQESFRVMRPGGVIRVVAPSLEWAMSFYQESDPARFLEVVFENNHTSVKNRHQWMYTGSSLADLLIELGFKDVRQETYRQGRLPDVQTIDNRPENSIYVEGIKP